jgi:hypothetical protein
MGPDLCNLGTLRRFWNRGEVLEHTLVLFRRLLVLALLEQLVSMSLALLSARQDVLAPSRHLLLHCTLNQQRKVVCARGEASQVSEGSRCGLWACASREHVRKRREPRAHLSYE